MTDKTMINHAALKRYCDRLPACARFLENFFLTASGETYGNNLQNYRLDLELYRDRPHIRKHRTQLERAFFEIAQPAEAP